MGTCSVAMDTWSVAKGTCFVAMGTWSVVMGTWSVVMSAMCGCTVLYATKQSDQGVMCKVHRKAFG